MKILEILGIPLIENSRNFRGSPGLGFKFFQGSYLFLYFCEGRYRGGGGGGVKELRGYKRNDHNYHIRKILVRYIDSRNMWFKG